MTRAVLDTNVYVSSIFWKGSPHRTVLLALRGAFEALTSPEILTELRVVLKRDFDQPDDLIRRQIDLILAYASLVIPTTDIDVLQEDPDDNKVLECAVDGDADYVVTGDGHLLDLGSFEGIRMVKPRAFLDVLQDAED